MAQSKKAPFRWGILITGIFVGIIFGLALAITAAWKAGGNAITEVLTPNKDRQAAVQRPGTSETPTNGKNGSSEKSGEKTNFDFYHVLPEGGEATAKRPTPSTKPGAPERTTSVASIPDKTAAPTTPPATTTPPAKSDRTPAVATAPAKTGTTTTAAATPSTTTTASTTPATPAKAKDIYWLQVGSFSRQEDAENRKAELALLGWEAAVQKGEAPGRGVLYRVRVGPFDNAEQTGRMKAELSQRKFDVAVVRQ